MLAYILCGTAAHWWVVHRDNIIEWKDIRFSLSTRFLRSNVPMQICTYHGDQPTQHHIYQCERLLTVGHEALPPSVWVHILYSTLQGCTHVQYVYAELHRETGNQKNLTSGMIQTFDYFSSQLLIEEALKFVKWLTMGDSTKVEELIQELMGETKSGTHFVEEG